MVEGAKSFGIGGSTVCVSAATMEWAMRIRKKLDNNSERRYNRGVNEGGDGLEFSLVS
jgi:hypothetical protein